MYPSPAHEEALGHLFYGVSEPGGFVLLTGEVGTGKTTLVRTLLERLPDTVDVALILNPRLSPAELVAAVCDELAVRYPRGATLKTLVDELNRHLLKAFGAGRRTVLVIDEAQALAPDVLEQVRLLTNLETTREKLLEVILVGQPELKTTLARADLRQLAQRITARYHLSPLGRDEVRRYVAHRLGLVGGDIRIFTPGGLVALARLSHGIPRLINEIADRCLLGAYAAERERIDVRLVRQAAAEVTGEPAPAPRPRLTSLAVIAMAAVALVFAVWLLQNARPAWFPFFTGGVGAGSVETVPPVVVTIEAPRPQVTENDVAGIAAGAPPADLTVGSADRNELPVASGSQVTSSAAGVDQRTPIDIAPEREQSKSVIPPQGAGTHTAAASGAGDAGLQSWIEANRGKLSFADAMSELSRAWGVLPLEDGRNLCQEQGWSCLARKGDWQVLSALDLPVALRLANDAQPALFLPLTGLTREDSIVRAGGKEQRFPRWALARRWAGEFTVLWPPPDGWDMPVRPGARGGDTVAWARRQLARLLARSLETAGPPEVYDPRLEEAVRLFQGVNGIAADGILDAETLLQLYAASAGAGRPHLWRDGVE
jgi:general secretion pathway protein A